MFKSVCSVVLIAFLSIVITLCVSIVQAQNRMPTPEERIREQQENFRRGQEEMKEKIDQMYFDDSNRSITYEQKRIKQRNEVTLLGREVALARAEIMKMENELSEKREALISLTIRHHDSLKIYEAMKPTEVKVTRKAP